MVPQFTLPVTGTSPVVASKLQLEAAINDVTRAVFYSTASTELMEQAIAAASVLAAFGGNEEFFIPGDGTKGPFDLLVAPPAADWLHFFNPIPMDRTEWQLVNSATAVSGKAVLFTDYTVPGKRYRGEYTRPGTYDPALVNLVVDTVAGTSYTATAGDLAKWKRTTSNSLVTVTLPPDLPVGWACHWEQGGTGQIAFVAASGATLTNDQGLSKTFARYSVATSVVTVNTTGAAAQFNLSGALSA